MVGASDNPGAAMSSSNNLSSFERGYLRVVHYRLGPRHASFGQLWSGSFRLVRADKICHWERREVEKDEEECTLNDADRANNRGMEEP